MQYDAVEYGLYNFFSVGSGGAGSDEIATAAFQPANVRKISPVRTFPDMGVTTLRHRRLEYRTSEQIRGARLAPQTNNMVHLEDISLAPCGPGAVQLPTAGFRDVETRALSERFGGVSLEVLQYPLD